MDHPPQPTIHPAPHPPVPPAGLWRREHLTRPLRLADLTDDLLWTKLLRAAPLALRPTRIVAAFFTLLIVSLIWRAPVLWPGSGGKLFLADAANSVNAAAADARLARADGLFAGTWASITDFLFRVPFDLLSQHPAWTIGLTLLSLPFLAIGGGTISRMVACEFSQSFMLPWTEALGLALRRRYSLIGAAIAPLLIVGILLAGPAVGGWVLLNWPGVNVLGALLYPLFLACGLAVTLILVGYALGQCLLTPAVVCENTDAIDAMQRAYAYVIASPLRLALYAAILLLQLFAVLGVLGLIVSLSTAIAAWGSTLLVGPEATGMVHNTVQPGGTWNAGASIIAFWNAMFAAILPAFTLSFYFSASTVLYTLLRRLNDGQDPAEIWTPGLAPGTLAQAGPRPHASTPAATPAVPLESRP